MRLVVQEETGVSSLVEIKVLKNEYYGMKNKKEKSVVEAERLLVALPMW